MDTQFDMSEATEWFDYLRSCGRKENTINDLQFVPVRGSHCERCEYRKICEAW